MRIMLKFVIDIDPDAAWRALHSPAALAELYGPLVRLAPLTPLPTSWSTGDEAVVGLSFGGMLPLGRQLIDPGDVIRDVGGQRVRILRDTGIPLSGPLAALDVWDHQIAVSPAPAAGTAGGTSTGGTSTGGEPTGGGPTGRSTQGGQAGASRSRTLWRERLVIGGRAAPALWPVLWATWQWRAARIRALAPTWTHDPEPADPPMASTPGPAPGAAEV